MKNFKYVLPVLICIFALSINMNKAISKTKTEKDAQQDVEVIEMSELSDLVNLFKKLGYTSEAWAAGDREIPRITFDKVNEGWKTSSSHIPVKLKKQVFFRVMAPLVLIANENILKEREDIKNLALNDKTLHYIAKKYHLINNIDHEINEEMRQQLLSMVDVLPPSLVLAQAAEESGWGTSRFTSEGNAFFGQWDFSGNGMVPKHQRKELGNYGLARFVSPLASVEGYLFNINTHKAYQKLRKLRASIRKEKRKLTGIELASTLDKYSERGQAYIDGIISMIKYNNLQHVDDAYLSSKHLIKLINKA
ncbi:MAG: glucosaminidase domain-containing protein [Colwellia sp.]